MLGLRLIATLVTTIFLMAFLVLEHGLVTSAFIVLIAFLLGKWILS